MNKTLILTAIIGLVALPAFALPRIEEPRVVEPSGASFGLGLTWNFGKGASTTPALSFKVFSERKEDTAALSLGLDYSLANGGLRPNLGVAYLGNNTFIDTNIGYNFTEQLIDFGVATGFVDTKKNTTEMVEIIN